MRRPTAKSRHPGNKLLLPGLVLAGALGIALVFVIVGVFLLRRFL